MRYLRMKKRWRLPVTAGQVVVIPAANDEQGGHTQDVQPVFGQVTGETTKNTAASPGGKKAKLTGLTAPYLTFPMR